MFDNWLSLSILSILFLTSLDLFKKIIAVDSKNPRAASFIYNVYGASFALITIFFTHPENNIPLPTTPGPWLFLVLAALLWGLFERTNFFAIKLIPISVFITIMNLGVFIAFVGSLFLYNESFTFLKFLGACLIFIAILLVSVKREKGTVASQKGILIALMVSVFLGLGWMLDKKGVELFDPSIYVAFVWGLPLVLIYFFPRLKKADIIDEFKRASWRSPFAAFINVTGYGLQIRALQIGEATKVIPVVHSHVILTVILGIILLREREDMYKKILAIVLAFAGAILLS